MSTREQDQQIAGLLEAFREQEDQDVFVQSKGRYLEYYLVGPIEEASHYIKVFNAIRNCGENDTVKVHINSGGGDLDTALQFMQVLNETAAETITSVVGSCMSAATMIFLSGDQLEVMPHSRFMFHNYSGGAYGKGGELHDQIVFDRAWSSKLFHDIYRGFLTPEEITSLLNNKDIYMTSEEAIERAAKAMLLKEEQSQSVPNGEAADCKSE